MIFKSTIYKCILSLKDRVIYAFAIYKRKIYSDKQNNFRTNSMCKHESYSEIQHNYHIYSMYKYERYSENIIIFASSLYINTKVFLKDIIPFALKVFLFDKCILDFCAGTIRKCFCLSEKL